MSRNTISALRYKRLISLFPFQNQRGILVKKKKMNCEDQACLQNNFWEIKFILHISECYSFRPKTEVTL